MVEIEMIKFTGSAAIREQKRLEAMKVEEADEQQMKGQQFGRSRADLWLSLKLVFANPTFIFLSVGAAVESGAVMGFAIFMPKVLQFMFSLTPAGAAILAGKHHSLNSSFEVRSMNGLTTVSFFQAL